MTEAERLNDILEREAPLVHRMLSPLGRRAALPRGILFQTAQASDTTFNATIGQVTDGHGQPMPLPVMESALQGLDRRMSFLYSPQQGQQRVREAWQRRQRALSGGSTAATSLPVVTHGLTQGISLVADLFADEDTEVVVPSPFWGNYNLIFTLRHGARIRTYPFFDGDGFNVRGLEQALSEVRGKAIVMLNIPGNPTGFTPSREQVAQIADIVAAHPGPAVAVCDDAYQGMLWEDDLPARSLFWDLLEKSDPERLMPIKIDGTTKELFFFPGRVGFFTHGYTGEAEAALLSKLQGLGRATVGSPPGPSQALVLRALESGDLDASLAQGLGVLRERYRTLKAALDTLPADAVVRFPFNSGCFALVGLADRYDADTVRMRLIEEQSVGLLAIPDVNGLRIAYCGAAADDLAELVSRLAKVLAD